jgi:hypothetical protein
MSCTAVYTMRMIEVFKTNICCETQAAELMTAISKSYPHYRVNMDLQDCDNILRIVAHSVDHSGIIQLAGSLGYNVEVLPD